MEGTSSKRNIIDIGVTAAKHKAIVLQFLAMHALTGCDTVSYLWGVGKNTALKVLANITQVVREATEFIAACYVDPRKILACPLCGTRFGLAKQQERMLLCA